MAWTATVLSAVPNATPDDSIVVQVQFSDGTRSFTKSYNMNGAAFPDVNAVQAHVTTEVANIQAAYDLADSLNAAPINIVPGQVTALQARLVLIQSGLFDAVDAQIKAAGAGSAIYQAWEYANNFYRRSPLIDAMAQGLGLSDAQVDDLFKQAAVVSV